MHCNPVQGQNRARTGFSQCSNSYREKPVFITGNPFSHCRDPVFIQGVGLQCVNSSDIVRRPQKFEKKISRVVLILLSTQCQNRVADFVTFSQYLNFT